MPTIKEILDFPSTLEIKEDKGWLIPKLVKDLELNFWPNLLECHATIINACDAITVEVKARCQYDFRRSASLYVISYENKPAIIAAWAGREEDDSCKHYIVDSTSANKLISYLKSLCADILPEATELDIEIEMPMWENRRTELGKYWNN